jgi:Tol biopolymer transport system component
LGAVEKLSILTKGKQIEMLCVRARWTRQQLQFALCLSLLWAVIGCNRSEPLYEGLSFSPDGRGIFAVYAHSGSSFIYEIPLDTGKATRFTRNLKGFEGVPSFSPDGKQIAYSYSPGQKVHSRIMIANSDGSDPHPFSTSETDDFRPLFSPDNKTIIFARSEYFGSYSPIAQPTQHEWNFYMSDLSGGNMRQLTHEDFYMVSRASVSPDGKSLLFASVEISGDGMLIYSLEQRPKPKRFLKPRVKGEPSHSVFDDPIFLPDGSSVLFLAATTGASGAFDYDVYRMDLQTQEIEKITAANGYAYNLQVSPDGKRAVFVKGLKEPEIVLLDLETHKLTSLRVTGLD